jgi:hypothetical protein
MATKKKTNKKKLKSKSAARKKAPAKKSLAKKKPAAKKATVKMKAGATRRAASRSARGRGKREREKTPVVDTVTFSPDIAPEALRLRAGGQSGALQGLSNLEGANSESVDELLEEGNAFEAEVVQGVEDAGDADQGEVRTHQSPVADGDVQRKYRSKK